MNPYAPHIQEIINRHVERILSGEQAAAAAKVTEILDRDLELANEKRKAKKDHQ